MPLKPTLLLILSVLGLSSFRAHSKNISSILKPKNGLYRAEIKAFGGNTIPFQFLIQEKSGKQELVLINAEERIKSAGFLIREDSVIITLPFFDAELRLRILSDKLEGNWVRYLPAGNRYYPMLAMANGAPRFKETEKAKVKVSGLWDIQFKGYHHPDVGEFNQEENGRVTGSILSVTGDYRFLEGRVNGDSLYLSTFDGAHAYFYKARVNAVNHSLENGEFYPLNNPPVSFSGQFNPNAKLPDVYSVTKMKAGVDTLGFHFKDIKGMDYTYPNAYTKNKITLIQFFGSWCPNCMDETAFLTEFYKKHKDQLAIIGLAYERSEDWNLSRNAVQRFSDRFQIPYPTLVTGFKNQNADVLSSMPALANYEGFPTLIIIDKKGKVQKIHTGFSGPGTGKFYTEFENEFNELFKELNAEN